MILALWNFKSCNFYYSSDICFDKMHEIRSNGLGILYRIAIYVTSCGDDLLLVSDRHRY